VWPRPRFGDNLPFARHGQAAVALLEPKNILAVVRSLLSAVGAPRWRRQRSEVPCRGEPSTGSASCRAT
jgi:hypothetical protein